MREKTWRVTSVVLGVMVLVLGLFIIPWKSEDAGPRPVLLQYQEQVYLLGFAEGDSLTAEEAREVNHNILAFVISQTSDSSMLAAMEAVGFAGPRNVTDQVKVDPGG